MFLKKSQTDKYQYYGAGWLFYDVRFITEHLQRYILIC